MTLALTDGFLARLPLEDGQPAIGNLRTVQATPLWTDVLTPAGRVLAFRANTAADVDGTPTALFALFGRRTTLRWVNQNHAYFARPMRQFMTGAATNPTARGVLRRWRWWRIDGDQRAQGLEGPEVVSLVNATVRLIDEGEVLPDYGDGNPLPWLRRGTDGRIIGDPGFANLPAIADLRVTRLVFPVLPQTLAGYELGRVLEEQEDEETMDEATP